MELRSFGRRSGLRVPRVSIGAMRLPRDLGDAVALVRHAIDRGLRYIDVSRGYGEAEWVLSHALRDGYRERVLLSTKWSPWVTQIRPDDAPTADCVRRRIEEQLGRLGTDYLDFYQVWNIEKREHYDQATAPGGMIDGIRQARAEGLVRHLGFTTHDTVPNLLEYLPRADWCEVLLVTYNLLNRTYAPVIAEAHRLVIGTIAMNPVGGGKLTEASPILMEIARAVGAISVPDLALRYLLSNPALDTFLCGMTRDTDVDDCLASLARGPLAAPAVAEIDAFLDRVDPQNAHFCTGCRYCLPCPQGIEIPAIMSCVYDQRFLGLAESASKRYASLKVKAGACAECGQCEERCTQHLAIVKELAFAAATFPAAN